MQQHTLLIASADERTARTSRRAARRRRTHRLRRRQRRGRDREARPPTRSTSLLLGDLQRPADSLALLRAIRAGEHPRIHPDQPIITLGAADEISTLRAYEAGSDHHLASDTGYLVLRAVIAAIARRTGETVARHIHVGELHIDTAARTADIDGSPVTFTRIELRAAPEARKRPAKGAHQGRAHARVWGDTEPTRSRARRQPRLPPAPRSRRRRRGRDHHVLGPGLGAHYAAVLDARPVHAPHTPLPTPRDDTAQKTAPTLPQVGATCPSRADVEAMKTIRVISLYGRPAALIAGDEAIISDRVTGRDRLHVQAKAALRPPHPHRRTARPVHRRGRRGLRPRGREHADPRRQPTPPAGPPPRSLPTPQTHADLLLEDAVPPRAPRGQVGGDVDHRLGAP